MLYKKLARYFSTTFKFQPLMVQAFNKKTTCLYSGLEKWTTFLQRSPDIFNQTIITPADCCRICSLTAQNLVNSKPQLPFVKDSHLQFAFRNQLPVVLDISLGILVAST